MHGTLCLKLHKKEEKTWMQQRLVGQQVYLRTNVFVKCANIEMNVVGTKSAKKMTTDYSGVVKGEDQIWK